MKKTKIWSSLVLLGTVLTLSTNIAQAQTQPAVSVQQNVSTGLVHQGNNRWLYFRNGKVDTTFTGLVEHYKGFYYVNKGELDWTFTGLFHKGENQWSYVKNGKVDKNFTGLVEHYKGFYYVNKGELDWTFTGLFHKGQNQWSYVKNGKVDKNFTGLVEHYKGWYYINRGELDWTFTGIAENPQNKRLFYVKAGKLDWSFNGLVTVLNEKTKYVQNGEFASKYRGLVNKDGKEYFVNNGLLDDTNNNVEMIGGHFYQLNNGVVAYKTTVNLSNVDAKSHSFKATLKATEKAPLREVFYFVWSDHNGQDDLIIHQGFGAGTQTNQSTIRLSAYNFQQGKYHVHVYARENGQNIFMGKQEINVSLGQKRADIQNEVNSLKSTYHNLFDSVGGRRSMYVIDSDGYENFSINRDTTNPAASTIKLFIMAAVFNKASRGEFNFNATYTVKSSDIVTGAPILKENIGRTYNMDQLVRFMMEKSDNTATNALIRQIGGIEATNNEFRRLGYTKTVLNRYMWDYSAINRGIDNYISAQEAGDLIKNIYNKKLVNYDADTQMLDRLSRNYYAEWLTANIRHIAQTWDKPGGGIGTNTDNDIAIIKRNGRAYIVATLNYFGASHQKSAVIRYGSAVAQILDR